MRFLNCFIFLVILTIIIIIIFFFFKPLETISDRHVNITDGSLIYKSPDDNYTRCLIDAYQALNSLSIPWFLTFETALMYRRSKNFISDDMDIGIFYENLHRKNFDEEDFIFNMANQFDFKLLHRYGQIDHGQEWAFSCPKSRIKMDIFLFYQFNETNISLTYWTASYNGLCDEMIYRKCRWGFSDFKLTTFEMSGKTFYIVPEGFIIESYGKNYMIPKQYEYHDSLTFLPNLIHEYNNPTRNRISSETSSKQSVVLKYRRKRRKRWS